MRSKVISRLLEVGVIPIVRVDSADAALRIAEALVEGGSGTVEIAATVPGAFKVIEALTRRFPELFVGAGTVLDASSVRAAVDAGARYIISVGILEDVVRAAHRYGAAAIPGVFTPTEAVRALECGADALKLFPASVLGPGYLKALRAPLPQAVWCPTGGVSLENLRDWIAAGASMVGVGSPLLQDVARTQDWAGLTRRMKSWTQMWERCKGE
ncbi:MAG: bifunctional 4-hydroxy-2-oxoglutarate aldolase/2-dehydro-3-deoxy-phosphogluconate aldolase [Firmicutes bacterium]|nr:bifunctional 4-hydroxy-2-oxoglutarate aldolase/2-dehydro-3-deoxy-phosphogluconate aldolase [Bacillota bacterium]